MLVRSARGRRLASLGVVAALAACGSGTPAPEFAVSRAGPSSNALPAFRGCDTFTRQMQKLALARVTEHGLDLYDTRDPDDVRISDLRVEVGGFRQPAPAGGSRFAEADDLQSDGQIAVSITAGNTLRVIDVSGHSPAFRGAVRMPGEGYSAVILTGGVALAISPAEVPPPQSHMPPPPRDYVAPPPNWTTDLTLIDLARPAHPRILGTEEVTGRLVSAYVSGGAMRVVLSTDPERRLQPAATDGVARNEAFIRNTRAVDWLPDRQIRNAEGKVVKMGPLLACADVHRPAEAAGLDLLSILTFDPRDANPLAEASAFGILASGDAVAASPQRLYVATTAGWGDRSSETKEPARSRIHGFDTTGTSTRYLGSGELDHYLVAQGGLSARDQVVRAVTTTVPPWRYSGGTKKQNNGVVVLREAPGRLKRVGSLRGLSEGRPLGVIRWFDDLVAIAPSQKWPVTSVPNENAGPLTLVDLSHPVAPRSAGTLDLPGDTAYLEPIGGGLVVAIGERPAKERLGDDTVEVSTLDLSHLGHPRRLDTVSYGNADAYVSPQELTWLPDQRTILVRSFIAAHSPCPTGLRCANSPPPPCLRTADCKRHPANLKIDGLVALHVSAHGDLRPRGWLASESLSRLSIIGGDLWGHLRNAMVRLDPRTLRPLARKDFPKVGRP